MQQTFLCIGGPRDGEVVSWDPDVHGQEMVVPALKAGVRQWPEFPPMADVVVDRSAAPAPSELQYDTHVYRLQRLREGASAHSYGVMVHTENKHTVMRMLLEGYRRAK